MKNYNQMQKWSLLAICAALLLSGCGMGGRGFAVVAKIDSGLSPDSSELNSLEEQIWSEVSRWQGVPYLYGGNGRKGIDCSGFTTVVYRNLYDIRLPRTTLGQVKIGKSVSRKKLKAGDLIFFRNPDRSRHVGIYLWGEKFAHASKKKGKIIVSHMKNPYWQRTFWKARRVL